MPHALIVIWNNYKSVVGASAKGCLSFNYDPAVKWGLAHGRTPPTIEDSWYRLQHSLTANLPPVRAGGVVYYSCAERMDGRKKG